MLADHDVLASVGSTGDAYDNSMAESFLDSFKTELYEKENLLTRLSVTAGLGQTECATGSCVASVCGGLCGGPCTFLGRGVR
jgi:hypothetical protein